MVLITEIEDKNLIIWLNIIVINLVHLHNAIFIFTNIAARNVHI